MAEKPTDNYMSKDNMTLFLSELAKKFNGCTRTEGSDEKYMSRDNMVYFLGKLLAKMNETEGK